MIISDKEKEILKMIFGRLSEYSIEELFHMHHEPNEAYPLMRDLLDETQKEMAECLECKEFAKGFYKRLCDD